MGSVLDFNPEQMKCVLKPKLYKIRDVYDKTISQDSSMAKIILTESADDQYDTGIMTSMERRGARF